PGAEAGFDRIVSPGEEVVFKGTASVGEGDGTNSFQWEFGDGDGAEGEQVTHQYDAPGDYRVRLTVGDASGGGCVSSDDITVRVNSPPVVVLMGPGEAVVGGAHDCVFFDASGSYDPDGDGVTFLWDFGDGGKGRGARVLHCFENPGQYTVSVFVDDGNGVESSVVCKRMGITVYERK
ncbi:MAG: PKD domain-containing protein, partial [Deltaproteobacteria bacterium]|nr:PKD domain-containing protein [Deltaproteobacteria bacterium]